MVLFKIDRRGGGRPEIGLEDTHNNFFPSSICIFVLGVWIRPRERFLDMYLIIECYVKTISGPSAAVSTG